MGHHLRTAALMVIGVTLCMGAATPDRPLDEAKRARQAEIDHAQAELDKAQAKFRKDTQAADAKLIKAYDEAIKRVTQRGDIEGANKLLAERKLLSGGDGGGPAAAQGAPEGDWKWEPIGEKGIPPIGYLVTDVADGAKDEDYLAFFEAAKLDQKVNGHEAKKLPSSPEGTFPDFAQHNIHKAYVAFYLQCDSAQQISLSLRTTPFGSLHVWLDGKQILDYGADNKRAYEGKVELKLRRGKHVVVVRHANTWADCWFGMKFSGGKLLIGSKNDVALQQ